METNEHSITEDVDADTDLCRRFAHSYIYTAVASCGVTSIALQPQFFVFRL